MKLHGMIEIRVHGERVLRDPGFWDRVKGSFGAKVDLRTDRVKAELEAATLVEGARRALTRLGVDNAISLVIDRQVIFEDREGRPDDLVDLMVAFHDNESVFGSEFELLRLVVEHEEAGLHAVIEVMARSVHPADETAARVVVGGRIRDFEPRPGEEAEAYRARVEPLMQTPAVFETHRAQFESLVERLADALRGTLADAEISVRQAEARVEKPERARPRRPAPALPPTDRRYDPYETYYPSPLPGLLSMMMWGSMLSWAMMPHYTVINHVGTPLGATDAMSHEDLSAAAAADDLGADGLADGAGYEGDDFDADFGAEDFGGDDFDADFDMGGDLDFDFFDW
jgi:hypothetical protein